MPKVWPHLQRYPDGALEGSYRWYLAIMFSAACKLRANARSVNRPGHGDEGRHFDARKDCSPARSHAKCDLTIMGFTGALVLLHRLSASEQGREFSTHSTMHSIEAQDELGREAKSSLNEALGQMLQRPLH